MLYLRSCTHIAYTCGLVSLLSTLSYSLHLLPTPKCFPLKCIISFFFIIIFICLQYYSTLTHSHTHFHVYLSASSTSLPRLPLCLVLLGSTQHTHFNGCNASCSSQHRHTLQHFHWCGAILLRVLRRATTTIRVVRCFRSLL